MPDFQVAVLGAGPGGYEAAIRCARRGLSTVLIEDRELGGTCLNRGCIPTKALMHCAQAYFDAKNASMFGVITENTRFDYGVMCKHKDGIVNRLRGGIESLEKAHGVTLIKGFGKLDGAHAIVVGHDRLCVENIILATGSSPSLPPIPGIDGENILTSDDVLSMSALLDSFIIIGGGVIGIEFATLFSHLGRPVTILEMLPSILPGIDREIVSPLTQILKRRGVTIHTGARVKSIQGGGSVRIAYEQDGKNAHAEGACCVVCAGRKPNTAEIGLETAALRTRSGFIDVDGAMRTGVPNIYAIGDITGKAQLAHVAAAQALVAADNCAGMSASMRYDVIPACVYTAPEIAYVGLIEQAAREEGYRVSTGKFQLAGNGKAMLSGENGGLVKLVVDGDSGVVLGAQMMGPRATDIIAEIAVLMRCEGTIEELADTIHPHPTISEAVMEAALDVYGLSCHIMPTKL